MRTVGTLLFLTVALVAALPSAVSAAEQVDLLLVLAADVSRSIDAEKFQLQREGYAAAISDPRVLEAIGSGRNRRIGLTFVEWSGVGSQRVVIDWTMIAGAESAKGFGDRVLEAPRSFGDRTSIIGRDRIRHGAACARTVRIGAAHDRCFWRWHQQCGTRRDLCPRRSVGGRA